MKSKSRIGITLGDPAGIGPEVAFKALSDPAVKDLAEYVLIGDRLSFPDDLPPSFEQLDFRTLSTKDFEAGRPSRSTGRAALESLKKAVKLLKTGKLDALVTAPVSKEAIHQTDGRFQGHTEYLAEAFDVDRVEMMFAAEAMRTVIATRHIPLRDVGASLDKSRLIRTFTIVHQGLNSLFNVPLPVIGVCGVNPHAGEGGLMGQEEIDYVIPAINEARSLGMDIRGPFAADTLFSPDIGKEYDAIIAMYHDQGLIPVKTLYFKQVVNVTLGLPIIRTSPAHGTAFPLAGKNRADSSSMKEAVKLAVRCADQRRERLSR